MRFSSLQKLGGMAIIAGSVLFAVWAICWTTILPVQESARDASIMILDPNWIWINSLALFGLVLMIFGFTAIYSRLYKDAGISGLSGYLLIMAAYILETARVTWEIFVYPAIVGHISSIALFKDRSFYLHPQIVLFNSIANITTLLGVILFCKMLVQSRKFPKIAGILFFAGAVVYAAGASINSYLTIIGVLVLSVGCFIIGQRMFSVSEIL